MKNLVLYASKYGCTEDCAKYLIGKLTDESSLVNLKNIGNTDLDQFEYVIIGSPIYMGKIRKEVKQLCENNLKLLLKKKIMLFVCCSTPEQEKDFFKNNYPADLLANAVHTVNFGGELRREKMRFLDKKITTIVTKSNSKKPPAIRHETIDFLSEAINAHI